MSRVLKNYDNVITNKYEKNIHNGLDIVGRGYVADYIVAHSKGVVVDVRSNYKTTDSFGGSYGNYVKIRHDNNWYTLYAHLKYGSVEVKKGDIVEQGQIIGYMGATGYAFGVHLHFEIRDENDMRVNPKDYIDIDLPENENKENIKEKTVDELAKEVIDGKYGNGIERKNKLGDKYNEVQKRVNEILSSKELPKTKDSEYYIVKSGDNLSLIASKYNMTWQELYNLNKEIIDNTAIAHGVNEKWGYYNYIYQGQKLRVK